MMDMNEKRLRCKFSLPEFDRHIAGKIKHNCICNGFDNIVKDITAEQCERCPNFKSKYIEYPIEVKKVNISKFDFNDSFRRDSVGKPVSIRPCGEEYEDKTYLGIFLGELPMTPYLTWNEKEGELSVKPMTNPAIFIPELKKIIFGAESWWSIIEDQSKLKEISDELINSQWYVQCFKAMTGDDTKE